MRWLCLLVIVSCHHNAATIATEGGGAPSASISVVAGPSAETDAGAAAPDAPRVWATALVAPIFSAMEWPPKDPEKAEGPRKTVVRVGYVRDGESVPIKSGPTKKQNCPEGWYELLDGGFICGQFVASAQDRIMLAPPLTDGPLPYQYGLNLTNGAPLYRRIPMRHEREENEKHLLVGRSHPGDLARAQQAAMPMTTAACLGICKITKASARKSRSTTSAANTGLVAASHDAKDFISRSTAK